MKTLTEASVACTDNLNAKIPEGMTYHITRNVKKNMQKRKTSYNI